MQPASVHHLPWAKPNDRLKALTVTILSLWFLVALSCSLLGVFDSKQRLPIPLGAAALLPVVAYAICYLTWTEFRRFVLAANLRLLTLAQTWRVGGVVFLILHHRGLLPGMFALPAGWGDIAIGATAPFVALAISSKTSFPKKIIVAWNLLGMLDLMMAVTLGILASASPLGVLAGEITTQVMGTFPLSLIPTFFVPLLIIFHLISLGHVWHEAVHR
jgi:hypothetical protein